MSDESHSPGHSFPPPPRLRRSHVLLGGLSFFALLGGLFAVGWHARWSRQHALVENRAGAVPRVAVVRPMPLRAATKATLPGNLAALEDTVVYPQVSGYVRKWFADMGDRVEAGQLLAEIDTPDLDQQIAQAESQVLTAKAAREQAEANLIYAQTTVDRDVKLARDGLTSAQQQEQNRAQYRVATAGLHAAEANVAAASAALGRLKKQKAFASVRAPFAGLVSARTVERGALVTVGNGTPLYRLTVTNPLRVLVQVPQNLAPAVRVDAVASLRVNEYAGRTFPAKIARASGLLDNATRTMTTELRVDNASGELLVGMFAEISLELAAARTGFEVPPTAVANDAKGLRVATVTAQGSVHWVPITIDRDAGATIIVRGGLTGDEWVIKIASVDWVEGQQVERVVPAVTASASTGPG